MASETTNRGVEEARHRMRKWLQQLYQHRICPCFSEEGSWLPSADIHETEDAFHVLIELAGAVPEAIQVVIDGNTLCLEGERKRPQLSLDSRVHQMEIDFGRFRRSFNFPAPLDVQKAHSSYHQGFLEVTLPKLKRPGGSVRISLKSD